MRKIYIIILLGFSFVLNSQNIVNDKQRLDYQTISQPQKNVKEFQYYINKNAASEKNQKRYGMLSKFARFNEKGNVTDYHINSYLEFLSDRYKFSYRDNQLFEVQMMGLNDRLIYKWIVNEKGIITDEYSYDRKKRIKTKWISQTNENGIIKTVKTNRKNDTLYVLLFSYENNLLSHVKYLEKGTQKYYWEFEYNKDGRNTAAIKYSPKNILIERWKIEYTNNGDTLAVIRYNKTGVAKELKYYTYNENGNLVGYKNLNPSNNIFNEWKYIFDNEGKLIEQQLYNEKGILSVSKYEYTDKKLTKSIYFEYEGYLNPNLSYSMIKNYIYDNHGNIVEVITKDDTDKVISVERYRNIYF